MGFLPSNNQEFRHCSHGELIAETLHCQHIWPTEVDPKQTDHNGQVLRSMSVVKRKGNPHQICYIYICWLVVWEHFLFSIIYGRILPIDFKYFSRWLKPPTSMSLLIVFGDTQNSNQYNPFPYSTLLQNSPSQWSLLRTLRSRWQIRLQSWSLGMSANMRVFISSNDHPGKTVRHLFFWFSRIIL